MQSLTGSKRFWVAVASAAGIYFQDSLGISPDQIFNAVVVAASWIVGDSLRGTAKG